MARPTQSTGKYTGISQNITVAGTTAQATNAFDANTWEIRVCSTTACWINIGVNPTATTGTGSVYLPANWAEFFHVNPGQKIAAIQDTAGGKLNIMELSR
jgi:hypothetical protein